MTIELYIFASMKLSKLAQIAINGDKVVREFIMGHFDISRQTLHTWRSYNDPRLTDEKVVKFIAKHLSVEASQLVES